MADTVFTDAQVSAADGSWIPILGSSLTGDRGFTTPNALKEFIWKRDINNQTGTSYTLVSGDRFHYIRCANEAAILVIVPTANAVNFPIGTQIDVYQASAGQVKVTCQDVMNEPTSLTRLLLEQGSMATITKVSASAWDIVGDLEPA